VLALAITLLTGVTGYAADKVALSCSGTAHHVFWSLKGERNEENYPYHDSLTIDLDGRVVIWGSDTYPITEIERNLITFKGEVVDPRKGAPEVPPVTWNHYTLGVMDRITGDLSLSQNDKCEDLGLNHKTTFDLHCKPAKPLFTQQLNHSDTLSVAHLWWR
jgi:hypothetical protein